MQHIATATLPVGCLSLGARTSVVAGLAEMVPAHAHVSAFEIPKMPNSVRSTWRHEPTAVDKLVECPSVDHRIVAQWLAEAPVELQAWIATRFPNRWEYETNHRIARGRMPVCIEGAHGLAITRMGSYIKESLEYPANYKGPRLPTGWDASLSRVMSHKVDGTLVSLRNIYEEGRHFHLIHELLCRLLLLEREGYLEHSAVLLPARVFEKPFLRQFLAAQSARMIAPPRIVLQGGDPVCGDRVLFCHAGYYDQELYRMLNATWKDVGPDKGAERTERLFVFRSRSESRSFVNLPEVLKAVGEMGLCAVDLAGLSPGEQVRLFRAATLIVAEHGAGLANIVFCSRSDVTVVEIFPPFYTPPNFYLMARSLGYRYGCILANEVDGVDPYGHYSISPEVLAATVGRWT